MKIVVVGGGRVGLAIIRLLLNEQHDITVVESDPERAEFLATTMDVYVIEGRSDVDHLKEAGTAEADLLIAVTPSDENNLIACAVGRKLGAKHTIARVRDEEYYQDMVLLREELGLSMSINPERTAAKEISRCLRFPSAVKVEPFAHRQVELVEYKVSQDSKLCNVVLMDFREKFGDRVLVCTIERDGQVYIPSGKSQIEADDTITLVGAPESIHKLFRQIKEFRHETRNVMLLGGGRLAERLGQELQKLHIRFTVIEKDMKRCMELKAAFPEATIVCADGTQPDVLIEEGLEKMDALVALTESDTTNMVMSSFAKTEGVPQSTTLINEDHFVKMTEANGRTTVIQPPKVTAERIVEYVRWMQNSSRSSEIETLRMISDGQAEAVEFVARSDMDVLGVPLKELPLKSSVLIAAITRGRQCIIPNGNDCIQVGDHVVVVTTRHGMKELSDIMDYSAANDWKLSRKLFERGNKN